MIKRIFPILFILIFALLISAVSLKYTSGDFDVYYNTAQNYLNNAPIYIPHGGIDEFKYSPLFALFFSPLTLMSRISAIYVWSILNIIFLCGIFYLVFKLKQISFANFKDFLVIICLFALTGRYLFSNIKLGQSNVLLCFLMVLTMYLEIKGKYFWAAVILALSLMVKFFPLLLVIYFLLRRRFKLLAYFPFILIVFLLLPSLYSGFNLNLKYLHDWFVLLKLNPPVLLYSPKNNSLLAYFSWVFIARHEVSSIFTYIFIKKGLSPEVYCAWGASCLMFFTAFYYDTFFVKDKDPAVTYLDYSCLFVCGLLFNPLAYLNALVFLIIPYYFILRHLIYAYLPRKLSFIVAGLTLLCFILTMVDNKMFLRNPDQFHAFMEFKPLLWVIILVYVNLWLVKFSINSPSIPASK